MQIDFKNTKAVVTGGKKGIGKAIVDNLLAGGATVVILDIEADDTAAITNNRHFRRCNVADSSEVSRAFEEIESRIGAIDILINNAGIQTYGSVTEMPEELWDRTFNVNVKSMYLCAKYAIPLMKNPAGGVIVNVSSVQALICQKNVCAYAASKAAILGLTKSIAVDYAPRIRCVAVCPGAVMTSMLKTDLEAYDDMQSVIRETEKIHLVERIADAEEIATFILFLASPLAGFTTGHYYRVDGGIGVKIEGT
ncbi:MAG: SDR family oxidoreductase [Chitinophagaceae bacterium]|nr:SDR family oxidoreductase [Chitinophagaceae bacterium]